MFDTDKKLDKLFIDNQEEAKQEAIDAAFGLFGSSAGAYGFIWNAAISYADKKHSEDLRELRTWKEEVLEVEQGWDVQALAKMLEVPLGESCRKGIAEKIPKLISEKKQHEKKVKVLIEALDKYKEVDSTHHWASKALDVYHEKE